MRILIIDDDPGLRKSLSLILEEAGHSVIAAADGKEGLEVGLSIKPDLILCDVRMPVMGGLEFLEAYRSEGGEGLVIVMTAYGSLDLATKAMQKGAYDYLPKPFGADEVLLNIRKAEERERLRREVQRLREEVRSEKRFGDIIVRSPAMVRALEVARKVAKHPSPVLITGASGTGKELVSRLIHRESDRADQPFVAVNCGAIPENLLESEFFGYLKGAFTGADRDKEGLFEAAEGGTLFLDEVGELSPALQVKLLRALEEREIRRLGDTASTPVDVRIISATNRSLREKGTREPFREDLYYRLAVVSIHLPTLRERTEEIPDLVQYFLESHQNRLGIQIEGITAEAMQVLLSYPWPGNIRELENLLERAVVLAESKEVGMEDLPDSVRYPPVNGAIGPVSDQDLSVKRRVADLERHLIEVALDRTGGNRTRAAQLLELSPRALRYKIKDYGLS